MTFQLTQRKLGALAFSSMYFICDQLHTSVLRAKAIASLREHNLTLHVFHSRDCDPRSYYGELAFPIGGHYYELGHRRHCSNVQPGLVIICPYKGMYETPQQSSETQIKTENKPVIIKNTASWPHLFNRVEVLNATDQTKEIARYLEKMMKRETFATCGFHAMELSEKARSK